MSNLAYQTASSFLARRAEFRYPRLWLLHQELMKKEQQLSALCQVVTEGDDEVKIQKQLLEEAENKAWDLSKKLARLRRNHVKKLADELTTRLKRLGMEHARFDFHLHA